MVAMLNVIAIGPITRLVDSIRSIVTPP